MKPDSRSSRFAILGLLSLEPHSGYDIRKAARGSIGHFWSESYGQIYPALRALHTEGLVRPHVPPQALRQGRSDRQVWEITPKGREELDRWIAAPPKTRPVRHELLLKLFFGSDHSLASQVEHVARLRGEETARLELCRELERRIRRDGAEHPSLPFWLMTVGYGRHHAESLIAWCDETLVALRRLPRRPATRRPSCTAAPAPGPPTRSTSRRGPKAAASRRRSR